MKTVPKPGLRERKKARTRTELIKVAERLFRRQGYDATTLEQIAEEAEVSIRTVLRYFESKLQLALADHYLNLDHIRARIEDPNRELDTLTTWRNHVEESARSLEGARQFAAHLKFLNSVPALAAGYLEIGQGYQDALAAGLARDAGVDADTDLYGRLLAAMLVAGNAAAIRTWLMKGRKEDIRQTVLAVVDFAIENFPKRSTRGARRLASV